MVGVSSTWAAAVLTAAYLTLDAAPDVTAGVSFGGLVVIGPLLWFAGRRLRRGRSFREAFPWAGFMM